MQANKPANEQQRLGALRELDVLDTPSEEAFDRITRLVSKIIGAPIVAVSLVDKDRQWFKSLLGLDAVETPREIAFCAHAILESDVMVIPDAQQDERFANNPLVTGEPNIRFYAGAPLQLTDSVRLGTLCAIDSEPRMLARHQEEALRDLAAVVVDELRLRRIVAQQAEANAVLERQSQQLCQANQALQQFAHMASHDLRAPLKTIINMADIAMRDATGDTPKRLRYIRAAATDLEGMVAGYRRLSRLECAEKETRLVSQLIEDARKQASLDITAKVVSDVGIACDAALMTQVFANLISNASHYASTKSIVFESDYSDQWTVVRASNAVSETVPVNESIFAPFRRMTKEGTGTGLGLAIVDRVAQLHGGSVSAACQNNTFSVELKLPR